MNSVVGTGEDTNGIICIDKPTGMTSFDVIRKLRPYFGKKMGHAGTLDPAASGLLLIGVGKATKQLNELTGLSKVYEVEMVLGERRDTGDSDGEVTEEVAVPDISRETIENTLTEMEGEVTLPVPRYSAVKVEGRPLYKRARAGEEFTPPKKDMHIHKTTLHAVERVGEHMSIALTLSVGSGAYVRSIVEELGARLGYPATTQKLRRTRIGEYRIEGAHTLDEFNVST